MAGVKGSRGAFWRSEGVWQTTHTLLENHTEEERGKEKRRTKTGILERIA